MINIIDITYITFHGLELYIKYYKFKYIYIYISSVTSFQILNDTTLYTLNLENKISIMKWNDLIPPNLSFKFQQLLHASTTLIERMLEQNAKLPHRPIHNDPILKISH